MTTTTPELDLLDHVAVMVPCMACGEHYEIPLRKVLLSQETMHAGCPVADERDCPQVQLRQLVDEDALRRFESAWDSLRDTSKGRLVWRP